MASTLMQNPKSSVEVAKDPTQSVEVAKDLQPSVAKDPGPSVANDPGPSVAKAPDPSVEVDSAVAIGLSSEIGDHDGDGELRDVKAGLDCPGANSGNQGRDVDEVTQRASQMSVRPKNRQPEQQLEPLLQGADGSRDGLDETDMAARAMPNTSGARTPANAVGEETKTTALMKKGNEEYKVTKRTRRMQRYDQPAPNTVPTFSNCSFHAAVITGGTFGDFHQTCQSLPSEQNQPERNRPALDENHVVTTDSAVDLSIEYATLLNCEEQISIDDILDIAEEIGENWVALGRKLGMKTASIDNIKCRCHYEDQREMCVLLLEEWQQRVSEGATISKLLHTLINLKCRDEDIVPAIFERFSDRLISQ